MDDGRHTHASDTATTTHDSHHGHALAPKDSRMMSYIYVCNQILLKAARNGFANRNGVGPRQVCTCQSHVAPLRTILGIVHAVRATSTSINSLLEACLVGRMRIAMVADVVRWLNLLPVGSVVMSELPR
jgi:hypothetical protein